MRSQRWVIERFSARAAKMVVLVANSVVWGERELPGDRHAAAPHCGGTLDHPLDSRLLSSSVHLDHSCSQMQAVDEGSNGIGRSGRQRRRRLLQSASFVVAMSRQMELSLR